MPLFIFPHRQSDVQLHRADFLCGEPTEGGFKMQQGGDKLHSNDQ